MIKSFRCRETERVFHRERSRKFQNVARVAQRKLDMLNDAAVLRDLARFPNNKLEALKRERMGQQSIRVNDQWRVCFVWRDGHAYDVEIVDYH
jgi:proteic killer suppression protein